MMARTKNDVIKKVMITVPAAIALMALYVIIFGFSSQDAEQSGNLSMLISENAVEFLYSLVGRRWSQSYMTDLALYFEHPIRKLAHFGEYACVGILVFLIFTPWLKKGKGLYALVVVWVFISGACDEFHQLFVPGRWGSFADVCLDTCGGTFGLLVCIFVSRVLRRKKLISQKNKLKPE